ncbi:MAG: carbon starvation protein A [Candidatus Omnitrophica bacterium]|nr:carbon starvation protein A [Candidatus Omnitrophota bacterium]
MSLLFLIFLSIILFLLAYHFYGNCLSKWLKLRPETKTPAYEFQNDVDFVPTKTFYLLNQHLSAIAAAGPIVGPILAGMWFGWLPTFIWIILGGIFIGGVHDIVSIVASIRQKGRSIAEVIRETMNHRAFVLFLLFLWFSLVYIIAAFTDVTASTFVEVTHGPAIASSSMLYLLVALITGWVINRFNPSLTIISLLSLPLILLCVYLGQLFPLTLPAIGGFSQRAVWNISLIIYCFVAAIIPVSYLLQPRGYLGGFFLITTAGFSLIGLAIGSISHQFVIQSPAFVSWSNPQGLPLFPILFITVACGACSGFHCLIASGTTSKQLTKETDAKAVGYGGMLLESFVAIIALCTLLILSKEEAAVLKDPNQIFANGVATFLSQLGISKEFAFNFALLAFATFVYDTLDVATRLGRYIFEELTGWKNKWSPYVATGITLILPLIFLTQTFVDASGNVIPGWKMFWTVFGASNQLLAALVLFGLSLWLFKQNMRYRMVLIPAIFMILVATISLFLIIKPWLYNLLINHIFKFDLVAFTCLILFALTISLLVEGTNLFVQKAK